MATEKGVVSVKITSLVAWGIVLLLTQLLITQWTVRAAGNRDVLDYISFAGTVVSMLLAVLAIVYSFFATASQRGDAEAMRTQLDSLNQTVSRADLSGKAFEREVENLSAILDGVGRIRQLTEATFETLQKSASQQEAKVKQERSKESQGAETGSTANYRSALLRLAKVPSHWQLIVYDEYCRTKGDREELRDRIDQAASRVLASESDGFKQYMVGQAVSSSWTLGDLQLLDNEEVVANFKQTLMSSAKTFINEIESSGEFKLKEVYARQPLLDELRRIASYT